MTNKITEFSEGLWFQIDNDIITIGVTEEALGELDDVKNILIADEGDSVEADQMIGEVNSDSNALNIYSPVSGEIIEVNDTVISSPSIIYEDPMGECWLFRVQCDDQDELDSLTEEKEEVVVS